MANPTNWLIFEVVFVAVVGVIFLLVVRAANRAG
jgi:hypothetical protein